MYVGLVEVWLRLFFRRQNVVGIGTIIYTRDGVCSDILRQMNGGRFQIGAEIIQDTTIVIDLSFYSCWISGTGKNELVNQPLCQRSVIKGISVASATKDLIGIRAVIHEHVGTT